jgi:hypothetical protein
VGREIAGHPREAGESREPVEHQAQVAADLPAAAARGGDPAGRVAQAEAFDEGGRHVGVVGLVARQHLHAPLVPTHDSRHVVPEIDQPHELLDRRGGRGEPEGAAEEVAGAEDPVTRPKMPLVAEGRGHDRSHAQ